LEAEMNAIADNNPVSNGNAGNMLRDVLAILCGLGLVALAH
jgi:hypothetical protein